jgi:hypothetical protein
MAFLPLKIIGGIARGVGNLVQKIKAKKEAKLDQRVQNALEQKAQLAALGLPSGMLPNASQVAKESSLDIFGNSSAQQIIAKSQMDGTITGGGFGLVSKFVPYILGAVLLLFGFFFMSKKRR